MPRSLHFTALLTLSLAFGSCQSLKKNARQSVSAKASNDLATESYSGRTLFRANSQDCRPLQHSKYTACQFKRSLNLRQLVSDNQHSSLEQKEQQSLSLQFTFYCPAKSQQASPIVYVRTNLAEIDYESSPSAQRLNFFIEPGASSLVEFHSSWDDSLIVDDACYLKLHHLQYLSH